jgi:hypothetical protein
MMQVKIYSGECNMKNQFKVSDFSKFKATGILTNGKRFKAIISINWYYIEGINLWHGNKWGLLKATNKWVKLERVN